MPVPGRHHPEVVEGPLGELEQLVALPVALELQLDVELERPRRAVGVDLDRVVDDQVAGHDRVDPVGVAAHAGHRVAHGGQVHHARHAGEVLEHHPGRHERDLAAAAAVRAPAGQVPHVGFGHEAAAGVAQRVLQQDADGEGEAVEVGEALPGELGQAVDDRGLVAEARGGTGAERIGGVSRHGQSWLMSGPIYYPCIPSCPEPVCPSPIPYAITRLDDGSADRVG